MELDPARVAGLAISRGGPTSHVAILAAAMNIPAVVALGPRRAVDRGRRAGDPRRRRRAGCRWRPKPAEIAAAQTRLAERRARRASAKAAAAEPCRTGRRRRGSRCSPISASVAEAHGGGRERRRGLRPAAHRVPVPGPRRAAGRGRAARRLPGHRRRAGGAAADHPHARHRRRQAGALPAAAAGGEPGAGPARRARQPGLAASCCAPSCAPSCACGRRPGQIMLPMVASLGELRAVRAMLAELAAELGVAAAAARRDGRDAGGRGHRRPDRGGGRLPLDRHQRPDAIRAGHGPHQPAAGGRRSTPCIRRCCG